MTLARIDFLPRSLQRTIHARQSRRRCGLLAGLLLALSVGVSLHSWNTMRQADLARSEGAQLAARLPGIEEQMDHLAAEQASLQRALQMTDGVVPPVRVSHVIATVTHMLPDRITLHGLRIETEETPRQMLVVLQGVAASNGDLTDLERRLGDAAAFRGVSISESRAVEIEGRRVESFTLSFRVPLEVRVQKPDQSPLALEARP
jgi:Tfp pilus assembly protein PilN